MLHRKRGRDRSRSYGRKRRHEQCQRDGAKDCRIAGRLLEEQGREPVAGSDTDGAAKQVMVVNGDFSIESGIAGAARLFAQETPPTAVFCFNDEMAIGVLDYASRVGRSVPESLSVIGFDDIRFSRYMTPSLTTGVVSRLGAFSE